jgi:hypothetical protein
VELERIIDRNRFVEFARERGVRPDWHEPDEQDLTARVEGYPLNFDNAGTWPDQRGAFGRDPREIIELHVIFSDLEIDSAGVRRRGPDLAAVNLADLCAWASVEIPDAKAIAQDAAERAYKAGLESMAGSMRRILR